LALNVTDDSSRRPGDDTLRRYTDLVKITGMKAKFIDQAQEVRLLEEGVMRFDLSLEEARRHLRKVAEDNGYVFESQEGRRVEQMMNRHAGKNGLISRQQFENTAQILRDFTDKSIGEEEARRQLKRLMLQNGWRPRRSGLFWSKKWFAQVEV
jgi:hypothetical protein